jgi:DNA-binding NarL/FixJ family response regulator
MGKTAPFLSLTAREDTVVSMVLSGMTNREIADRLGRREQTIKNVVTVILKKTGTRSRAHLIARAFAETRSDAQRRTHVSYDRGFTDREQQVVWLILRGMTNAEIASDLGVCEGTIKNSVSIILKKAGARSRTLLATRVLGSGGSVHSNLARALYYIRGQIH